MTNDVLEKIWKRTTRPGYSVERSYGISLQACRLHYPVLWRQWRPGALWKSRGFGDIANIVAKLTRIHMIETNRIEPEPVSGNDLRRINELEAEYCCHTIEAERVRPQPVPSTGLGRMDQLQAKSAPPDRNQQNRT